MSGFKSILIYERGVWDQVSLEPGVTRDWIGREMIEKRAYDKLFEALEKTSVDLDHVKCAINSERMFRPSDSVMLEADIGKIVKSIRSLIKKHKGEG